MGKKTPEIIDAEFEVIDDPRRLPTAPRTRPSFLAAVRAGVRYIGQTRDFSFPGGPWWFGLLCHLIYYGMIIGAVLLVGLAIDLLVITPYEWIAAHLGRG